jgi:hypothetical protein
MGFERSFQKSLVGLNPWAPMFAFVALFQFLRGANFDAIYFSFIVAILLIDGRKLFPFEFPGKPKANSLFLAAGAIGLAITLTALPRRSEIAISLMVVIFLIAMALVWYKDAGPESRRTPELIRSKWLWFAVVIAACLWELTSYIRSDMVGDPLAYPTVSILMGPIMNDPIGRGVFVAVWLLIGFWLFRVRAKP